METVTSYLESAKLARKQVYRNLTIFPLLSPTGTETGYLTLEQALAAGSIQITEKSAEGSVPELLLRNIGEKPVLIIEGEELVGAKQNRIVNATFLVAADSEVVIPVSCVEQGRWRHISKRFESGKKMMHASLRREHQQEVCHSLKRGGSYRSDQGLIWSNIAEKTARMKVSSDTGAMADLFDAHRESLEDFAAAFRVVDCQTGALFAIDGQVVGLECFGCQDTFNRFFDKLVQSYALDAIDRPSRNRPLTVPPDKARRFLLSTAKSKAKQHPTIGLGEALRFESRIVSGAALVDNRHLLHLSAFRKVRMGANRPTRFERFSRRRDYRIY